MTQIVLDMSANTTKNDNAYLKRMLDELRAVDTGKHEIIIKAQLFMSAGQNIRMTASHFDCMYKYAQALGYKCTASVFDKRSLNTLLDYDIPFVKIANDKEKRLLIGDIPRKYRVYFSYTENKPIPYLDANVHEMFCISEYPADIDKYLNNSGYFTGSKISDHTIGTELFKYGGIEVWEKHYKLKDSTGLDAGSWAITPEELAEIL